MSGSTKLFQRAGSPLIQGHSRYARSFAAQWAAALVPAVLAVYTVLAATSLVEKTRTSLSSAAAIVQWVLRGAGGVAAAALVCALGVAVARGMGWRRAWLAGALVGAVVGVVVMFWTRQLL